MKIIKKIKEYLKKRKLNHIYKNISKTENKLNYLKEQFRIEGFYSFSEMSKVIVKQGVKGFDKFFKEKNKK